jgi:hypothetical protein
MVHGTGSGQSPEEHARPRHEEAMTFEDWIFSIHLLFAATLVGSLVMSWIVVVSMRTADTPAEARSLTGRARGDRRRRAWAGPA